MDSIPRQRSPRSDSRRNRDAIVAAAARVLAADPAASMEDVAAASGVTRTTVYRHFPNREALVAEIVQRVEGEVRAANRSLVDEDVPLRAGLARLARLVFELYPRFGALRANPDVAAALDRRFAEDDPVLPYLEQRRARGELRPDLPLSWMAAVFGQLCRAAAEEARSGRVTAEEAERLLAEALVRQLCTE